MLPMRSDSTIEFSAGGHNRRFVQRLNAMSSRMKFSQVVGLAALGSAVARRLVGDDCGVELFGRLGKNPRGHSGSRAADESGLYVLLDPSVVVTRLMTGAPRTKPLILSAISVQRRSTMPLVHPELCGVAITFGNS
jgi:hypothetical protein